jgi:hypothetical protein
VSRVRPEAPDARLLVTRTHTLTHSHTYTLTHTLSCLPACLQWSRPLVLTPPLVFQIPSASHRPHGRPTSLIHSLTHSTGLQGLHSAEHRSMDPRSHSSTQQSSSSSSSSSHGQGFTQQKPMEQHKQMRHSTATKPVQTAHRSAEQRAGGTWKCAHAVWSRGMKTSTPVPSDLLGTHISVSIYCIFIVYFITYLCRRCL